MSKIVKLDDKIQPDEIKKRIVDILNDEQIEDFFFFYVDSEGELTSLSRWADDYQLAGMLFALAKNRIEDYEFETERL